MRRVIACILTVVMVFGIAPVGLAGFGAADRFSINAYAASVTDDSRFADVVNGTTVEGTENGSPWYRYSDRWFTGSAYDLDRNLAALSSYAANMAVDHRKVKDDAEDSTGPLDVEGTLTEWGFADVQSNQYYFMHTKANSLGCVAGHRTLNVDGKKYTLLAVFPYSPNYGEEWAGNLTVGNGDMHKGFKAGRDEVLRFLRGYIENHQIAGDVKFWIVGHSRFAAVSNMLAGFIVGGGVDYLGDVKVAPEDMYCYTFATPATVKTEKLQKKEALSVAGYRGKDNPRYAKDSAGEEFVYTGRDAENLVNPNGEIFNCIRNCMPAYDLITQLPPPKWGYGRYGRELPITDGSAATRTKMLAEYEKFYTAQYRAYIEQGNEEDYKWKTIDFSDLSFVDVTDSADQISQAKMFRDRISDGMAKRADSTEEYVNGGYEEALAAAAGVMGICYDGGMEDIEGNLTVYMKAGLFAYLSFAVERLGAEGYNEDEAVAIAVEQLVELMTGKEINPKEFTVDNFLELFATYIVDNAEYKIVEVDDSGNGNGSDGSQDAQTAEQYDDQQKTEVKTLVFKTEIAEKTFSSIANTIMTNIPSSYKSFLGYLVKGYKSSEPIDSKNNQAAIRDYVFSYLHQCAYGTGDKEHPGDSAASRKALYGMIQMFFGSQYPDAIEALKDESGTLNGNSNAKNFLKAALKSVMENKYQNVGEAADAYVSQAVGAFIETASVRFGEDSEQTAALREYGASMQKRSSELRKVVMDMLFFERDSKGEAVPFNTKRNIQLAATFVGQSYHMLSAHLIEIYDAWMKAQVTINVAREDTISRMELLGEVYADKVLDPNKLDSAILAGIKAERKAGTIAETEKIFTDVKAAVNAFIKEKEEADKKAAEEAAKKEADDIAAANAVVFAINGLSGVAEIAVSDAGAIEAARAAFDALTEDQKAKVSEDIVLMLTNAELALDAAKRAQEAEEQAREAEEMARQAAEKARQEIQEANDNAAADAVKAKIMAIPAVEDITVADKAAIKAAREVYDFLTESQKAKVSVDLIEKLIRAESALAAAEEAVRPVAITSVVLEKTKFTYSGKVQKPAIKHVIAGDKVVGAEGYDVTYSGISKDAGSYVVTVIGKGRFVGAASANYVIAKAANPVKIKGKTVTVKASAIRSMAKTVERADAVSVKKAKTGISYQLTGVKKATATKYFKVNKKTGNLLVKKGLKTGTYKVKITVRTAEDVNYKVKEQTVTVKVQVK